MAIQLRRGFAESWAAQNPILDDGRVGVERDTGNLKVGDGKTQWNDLPYPDGIGANQVTSKPAAPTEYVKDTIAGIRYGNTLPIDLKENEAFMLIV